MKYIPAVRIAAGVLIVIALGVAVLFGYMYWSREQSEDKAGHIISLMEERIPGLAAEDNMGEDGGSGTGNDAQAVAGDSTQAGTGNGTDMETEIGYGRDPLAAISIDGIDIVGLLEVPAADIRVPVAAKGEKADGLAVWKSGSPVKGKFLIYGSMKNTFLTLSRVKPGDACWFTDIDGVRYKYRVMTQFHLKKWDRQDYDLMLAYYTDKDTRFVIGCDRK